MRSDASAGYSSVRQTGEKKAFPEIFLSVSTRRVLNEEPEQFSAERIEALARDFIRDSNQYFVWRPF
jgi:hypothetical protein